MGTAGDLAVVGIAGLGAYLMLNRLSGDAVSQDIARTVRQVEQYVKEDVVQTVSPLESNRDYNVLHPVYQAGYYTTNIPYRVGESVGEWLGQRFNQLWSMWSVA